MNVAQRRILKGALAAVVLALLFPPFAFHGPNGFLVGLGWGFLLVGREYGGHSGTVDVVLLFAEWIAIGIIAAILWRLMAAPNSETLVAALKSRNDAITEAARIQADAIIRAAEIASQRKQMDLLDHYR